MSWFTSKKNNQQQGTFKAWQYDFLAHHFRRMMLKKCGTIKLKFLTQLYTKYLLMGFNLPNQSDKIITYFIDKYDL